MWVCVDVCGCGLVGVCLCVYMCEHLYAYILYTFFEVVRMCEDDWMCGSVTRMCACVCVQVYTHLHMYMYSVGNIILLTSKL